MMSRMLSLPVPKWSTQATFQELNCITELHIFQKQPTECTIWFSA